MQRGPKADGRPAKRSHGATVSEPKLSDLGITKTPGRRHVAHDRCDERLNEFAVRQRLFGLGDLRQTPKQTETRRDRAAGFRILAARSGAEVTAIGLQLLPGQLTLS
jgi:hypothetical protein